MHFIHQIERLQKLISLIEQENTGTPNELAKRLRIKRRTLFDLLESLKSLGLELSYNRKLKTYHYASQKKIDIKFSVSILDGEEITKVSGGLSLLKPKFTSTYSLMNVPGSLPPK